MQRDSYLYAQLDVVWTLLWRLLNGGGGSGTSRWTPLAAGGTAAPTASTNFLFTSTGANGTINLPAAASAFDGMVVLVRQVGANTNGALTVNAGAGTTVESVAAPDAFGASTTVVANTPLGWVFKFVFQAQGVNQWILST